MYDDIDYREILADVAEYNSYLDSIFEEELLASWKLMQRTSKHAIFENYYGETRIITAKCIDEIFKE